MNPTLSIWQEAPLNAIISHILPRYHETHRRQLETLIPLAEKVTTVHKGTFSPEVLPMLQNIQAELLTHMMKEERVLFPMLNQGAGRGAAMPIQVMMHEHTNHEAAIEQLMQHTNNLQPPAEACQSWQRLYALIKEFTDDLQEHIELENDILFARALQS